MKALHLTLFPVILVLLAACGSAPPPETLPETPSAGTDYRSCAYNPDTQVWDCQEVDSEGAVEAFTCYYDHLGNVLATDEPQDARCALMFVESGSGKDNTPL